MRAIKAVMKNGMRRNGGFTLAEVLAGLLILSITVMAFTPLLARSLEGVFAAGEKSRAIFAEQGEMEDRIAGGIAYKGGVVPLSLGEEDYNIRGGIIKTENFTTFLAYIPTMSLDPAWLLEGYPDNFQISVTGTDTSFNGTTQLIIRDKDGYNVSTAPLYVSYSRTVHDPDSATIRLGAGLTNEKGPYTVIMKTVVDGRYEVVRAALSVMLPKYVAVGAGGKILVSDGVFYENGEINWVERPPGTGQDLMGVAWGAGKFVAVGEGGTILTSSGGSAWVRHSSGTAGNLNAVTWGGQEGGEKFVAVGDGGLILTSVDGITWVQGPPAGENLHCVVWTPAGGGMFVAAGGGGTIITSPDGESWTRQPTGTAERLFGLAWGLLGPEEAVLVAVGAGGTILASPDGLSWTARRQPGPDGPNWTEEDLLGVAFGVKDGDTPLFVAVGREGTILSSEDGGATWAGQDSETSRTLNCVLAGADIFIAAGEDGELVTSPDGETWTGQHTGTASALNCLAGRGK